MYTAVQEASLHAIGFPREYVQGPKALAELPFIMRRHGFETAFAVADPMVAERLRADCGDAQVQIAVFGGECTVAEAERIAAMSGGQPLVIGVGGGKCLDTAKLVSILRDAAFFSVPTIASNDAPTSRLVVLYDEAHSIVGTKFMRFNPDLVLVDTDIIAAAPVRFLRAGIGDALTKLFEARAVLNTSGRNFLGSAVLRLPLIMGSACLDTVLNDGPDCLAALAAGTRPEGLERLVEATILLSGITFESGGLSIAHAMTRGLTLVPRIAAALHGEQVSYGVLVQLALEQDAAMLRRIRDFNRSVGLPVRLADFGLDAGELDAARQTITDGTLTAPYIKNFPRHLGRSDFLEAMQGLERLN